MTDTLNAVASIVDDPAAMRRLLGEWAARGWLRALDLAFAQFLWREVADAPPLLILAAALASHQLGRGHASLDLAATLADPGLALSLPPEGAGRGGAPVPLPGELLAGLSLERWRAALVHPLLVDEGSRAGSGNSPLVLVGARLYLRRYWRYEEDLRGAIGRRLELCARVQAALPAEAMRAVLAALFPAGVACGVGDVGDVGAPPIDWQKIACALAARSAFAIVTGGPGTGKTTTVVKLLALLQALALASGPDAARALRIRLAAPTGKAAARLNASIAGAVARLPLAALAHGEAIRAAIPVKVVTLHRLLGSRPETRHFRHHAGNLLALDVLVVDEASMVDLEMMTAVLAALPSSARLILLGDKDQLASVEAGAVLGELCQRAAGGHYTAHTAAWLQAVAGERIDPALVDVQGGTLDQAVVMLRHSYRFAADSGIGRLAAAVNGGDGAALRRLCSEACADLAVLPLGDGGANSRGSGGDDSALRALVVDGGAPAVAARHGYGHYLELMNRERPAPDAPPAAFDSWARAVLQAHGQFQILCALRSGPWGVDGLNPRIARLLCEAGLIAAAEGWYPGRPVLVTRNDYGLGLMNGDIGITLAQPAADGQSWSLRVAFACGDDAQGIKWILPSRLQAVDTVYALTVHKSQGSEFAHAALVLPDSLSPILTRELIYTAVTRARNWLTLAHGGRLGVLEQAVERRVLRMSGLLGGE